MIIRNKDDINHLNAFLEKSLKDKKSIDVSVVELDCPTAGQIRLINALIRDLAKQSLQRGSGLLIKAIYWKQYICDLFLSDYFELQPDGSLKNKKASFKHGISKEQLNDVISNMIIYFNEEFGYDLSVKKSRNKLVTPN